MDTEKVDTQIKIIFDKNKLNDLNKFMNKRQCLNSCNIYMLYLFHLISSVGVLTTSLGASLNNNTYIWAGIGLNMLAGLIQIYEKINYSQLKKLMADIESIKNNKYIDESNLVDIDKDFQRLNSYCTINPNDTANDVNNKIDINTTILKKN